jgi:hypothetical protein
VSPSPCANSTNTPCEFTKKLSGYESALAPRAARAAVKDAENVTCVPNTEGLREEVAVTDGVDRLTTCIRVAVDWAIAAATATTPIHTNGAE